jgi:sec-independent protein translocase protein TatB
MFDIAWSEFLVIGAVALVVIGPKDLPKVLKTVGAMVAKARGLAREFQSGLDDMIRESELDELRKSVTKATEFNPNEELKTIIDPGGEMTKTVEAAAAEASAAAGPPPEPIDLAGEPYVPPADAEPEPAPALAAPPPIEAKPNEPTPAEPVKPA